MGFNNEGLDAFVANAGRARYRGVLGLNIGKNFDTPIDRAADDYLACLRGCYARASYVTINVSSPNTKGLRDLQHETALGKLAATLKSEQARLADEHGKYTPIAFKIAPDLTATAVGRIAKLLVEASCGRGDRHQHDARARRRAEPAPRRGKRRAVGPPLRERATEVVRQLARALDGALPIIGVGGILSGEDAKEKVEAGATLVQIYTGLIYRGPDLVAECVDAIRA